VTIFALLLLAAVPLFAQETVTLPNGMVIVGSTIQNIQSSHTTLAELAVDWTDSKTGLSAARGTLVSFYDGTGSFDLLTLAKDWAVPGTTFVAAGGTAVLFYDNGDIKAMTLSKDWTHPKSSITIKKGTVVNFFRRMKFQRVTLLKDLPLWDQFVAAEGTELHYFENGVIRQFTLSRGFTTKTGFPFIPGMVVELDDKGKILTITYTPAEDTPYGQDGPLLRKGKPVVWDGNGRLVEAVFADDWTDPAMGTVYGKDTTHTFR
jgi:hypothetical protein